MNRFQSQPHKELGGPELRDAVTWLLSADALAAVEVLPVFLLAGRWSWVRLRQGHELR